MVRGGWGGEGGEERGVVGWWGDEVVGLGALGRWGGKAGRWIREAGLVIVDGSGWDLLAVDGICWQWMGSVGGG